jgi:serine/threonine-protein kinase Stk1
MNEALIEVADRPCDIVPIGAASSIENSMLGGRYMLENILGIGGMGVVYRATDTMLHAFGAARYALAVKMVSSQSDNPSEAEKLLFTEYEIGAQLKHPNLVAIRHFDVCRQRQKAFLVMDWLEGLLLEELLYRQRVPGAIAIHLARQLVDAVAYCHHHGVIHGDIKPSNLIVSPDNHLTLFDFGISRWLYQPAGRRREAIAAFSCRYAAPELFDEHIPTLATDVFSVCCVLYRLFSGEHPFKDTTDEAAARGDRIPYIFGKRHPLDRALQQGLHWQHQERSCNLDLLQTTLASLTEHDLKTHWF